MGKSLVKKLRVGMTMKELVDILGNPSGTNPGSEMLGPNVIFGGSQHELESLKRTLYAVWHRPEGVYMLVLLDNRLKEIHSAPN